MSERSVLFGTISIVSLIFGLLLGSVLVLPKSAAAQQAVVRIDTVMNQAQGQNIEIPIILESISPGTQVRSFYFSIGYDGITPQYLILSDRLNECFWTYIQFYPRPNTECSGGYCPPFLLDIFLIKLNVFDCYPEEPTELCRIFASVDGEVGQVYPLRFFWDDCTDNSLILAPSDLDTILISDQVFDFDGTELTLDQPFPSHTGAPTSCLSIGAPDSVRMRGADFQNGGVGISYIDSLNEPRAAVAIEATNYTQFGDIVDIGVDLVPFSFGMTGDPLSFGTYDFLFSYDTGAVTFISATPGQLLVDCEWEYFLFRNDTAGLIRVVAVADTGLEGPVPSCLADSVGELAILTFQTTTDVATYECQFVSLDWMWLNCSDNTVAISPEADTLFLSNEVYNVWNQPVHRDHDFPTRYGAPTVCVVEGLPPRITTRAIAYYHGGFDFICADSIDPRGDINLNGVPNEIADWVMFTNYFFYGLEVFTMNLDAQIAASDVNADGNTLTFNDLMYIYRIIIGDALPFPSPPMAPAQDTVVLVQDTTARTVSVNYSGNLSALFLYFEGEIEPTFNLPHHDTATVFDSIFTKVLVFPILYPEIPLDSSLIDSGLLLSYSGNGRLVGGLAAYNGLVDLVVTVEGNGVSGCCVNRGNVDGIVGPGGPIDVVDLAGLVTYLFRSGMVIPCSEEANVNGVSGPAGPIDLTDLTYLVAYLFTQGPPPPPCL